METQQQIKSWVKLLKKAIKKGDLNYAMYCDKMIYNLKNKTNN